MPSAFDDLSSRKLTFSSPGKTHAANIISAINSAAKRPATLHPQSVQPAVDSLYVRGAAIRFNTLLPAIRLCTSPAQLAAVITGATSTFMSAPDEAIQVLQGWEVWMKDSDFLVALQQQVTDAVDDIAWAMADPNRTWSLCERASTLAVEVADLAQHDKRLAQNFLPAVDTLMAVTDCESFWQAIVDLLLCVDVPDVLRAVVAKVTGHGGHREDCPSWASRIATMVPRPDEPGPRSRTRRSNRHGPGRRNPSGPSDD